MTTSAVPLEPRPRRPSAVVRVAAAAALVWTLSSRATLGQPPYHQELLERFSTFDAGGYASPNLVDLDGDGDLDLVVGEELGRLFYLENTGSPSVGSFVQRTGAASPLDGIDAGSRSSSALVDLDGDDDLDAVVGNRNGLMRYFENTGSSTGPAFVERTGTTNPLDGFDVVQGASPDVMDLDGDGDLDVVSGARDGTLHYYENTGSSSSPAFAERTGTANPLDGLDAGLYSNPALIDVDGDTDLDAVVGMNEGRVRYYENTGTSTAPAFVERTGTASPVEILGLTFDETAMADPELVDLDGDGDLDAVLGWTSGDLHYFENTGSTSAPAFEPGLLLGVDEGLDVHPALVDLDGDGDLDAVLTKEDFPGSDPQDSDVRYFENTGSSSAPAFVELFGTANPFFAFFDSHLNADLADLDGDGDVDAVISRVVGTAHYLENTGSSSSPAFVERIGTANPFSGLGFTIETSPDLVDLDGDGDLDVVLGSDYGTLEYFENTGTSTVPAFVERTGVANPFDGVDIGEQSSPDLVDLDRDGDFDAVVGRFYGTLHYFENTGTSSAPAFVERTGAANPLDELELGVAAQSDPALVDLDADGDLDVFVGTRVGRIVYFKSSENPIFSDGFESGDTAAWSAVVPPP